MPRKTREERLKYYQEYYQENKDKIYVRQKEYKKKHKKEIAAWMKDYHTQYYLDNADEIRKQSLRYRELNRSKPKFIKSRLLAGAKMRSKKNGTLFNLSFDDFEIPEVCPVFNVPFDRGLYAPSLDRIIPKLGYVKGNVQVISHRANTLKRDASLEELQKLVGYLEKINTQRGCA